MHPHLKDYTCIALPEPGAEQISGQCLTAVVRDVSPKDAAEVFMRDRHVGERTILVTDGTYTFAYRVGGLAPC